MIIMQKTTTKILRSAALVAVTSAVLFASGCTKDPQGDLEDRVAKLEDAVKALEDKYNEGFLITSVEPTDGGYIITFSGGSDPLTISHGDTPTISVDASGDVFVNGQKLDGVNLMGETGADGIAPRIKVATNAEGKLTLFYTHSTAETPADHEWIDLGVDLRVVGGTGLLLAIEINDAVGTVTFVLNDGKETRLTFERISNAQSLAVLALEAIAFDGSEDVDLRFRVNPSTAWIPTGTGVQIEKWAIDEIEATRASYVNPASAFTITRVVPDGNKAGQYVATIEHEFTAQEPDMSNYLVALVLNNNKGTDSADDVLISSSPFRFTTNPIPDLPILETITNRGDIYENGTNGFRLVLTDIDWNQQGYSGSYVTIEFTSPAIDATPFDRQIDIPAGIYRCGGGRGEFSVSSLAVRAYENGRAVTNKTATGGTMTIEGDRKEYSIALDVTFGDGGSFVAKHIGGATIPNPNFWPFSTENLSFITGGGTYYGQSGGAGTSNFYFVLQDFDPEDRFNLNGTRLSMDWVTRSV